jgi:hypothetical protein
MDLNKIPKQFCDNITLAYSAEFFAVAMLSGQNLNAYTLTPQHAKRLLQYLSYNVENYEKTFGEIKADWKPGIQSPIQMIDLNK